MKSYAPLQQLEEALLYAANQEPFEFNDNLRKTYGNRIDFDQATTELKFLVIFIQFLIVDGGEYRWKGTFEQLETYFADNLPGAGSWSSPSGGVKLFTAKDFQIKWQRSKKLVIVRDTSDMYILKFFTQATVNDNTSPFNGPDADSNSLKKLSSTLLTRSHSNEI